MCGHLLNYRRRLRLHLPFLAHRIQPAVWSAKYEKREAEIAKATAAEISRQAQANARAKATEQRRIAELQAANQALEQFIKERSDEADAAPDRDRPALTSSAGMRIDAIHQRAACPGRAGCKVGCGLPRLGAFAQRRVEPTHRQAALDYR